MESEVVDKIEELISPFLREEDVELVEIVYKKTAGRMLLRLLLDKAEGINLEECSNLNRKIGEALDELNLIDEPYILEISSPGLDRPLESAADFKRAMGKQVKVVLNSEIEGKGVWTGEVVGVNGRNVAIKTEDKRLEIPLDKIIKAKKEIKFR